MTTWRVNFRRPGDDDTELFVEVPASDQASAIVRALACVWGAARLQRWGVKSVVQVVLLLALVLAPAWASAQQVVLTVREQQVLKTLFGTSGFIEQLLLKETASQPTLSDAGFARIMADSATHTLLCSFNGGAYSTCIGGSSGTVTNTGTLTLNQLVLGNGGVDIKSLGSAGTSTQVLHGGAPPTWSAVVSADLNLTTTSCGAGQAVTAISSGGVGTCSAFMTAPGGSNTQVQFNNAGAFGGSANLTFVSPTLASGTGDQFAIFDTLQAGSQRTVVVGGTSGSPLTTRGGVLEVFKTTSLTSVDASCANASDPNCGAAVQIEHRALGATQAVQISALTVSASSASTVASPGGDVVAGFFRGLKTAGDGLANGVFMQGVQRSATGFVTGFETSATWDQAADCPYSPSTFPQCIAGHFVANSNGNTNKLNTAIFINGATGDQFHVGMWLNDGKVSDVGIDLRASPTIGFRSVGAHTTIFDLSTATASSKAIALSSADVSDGQISWEPAGHVLEGNTPAYYPGTTNTGSIGLTTRRWNIFYGANLDLGVSSATTAQIILRNATNANTFTLQPGVTTANITFTLPVGDGAAGTCLSTNGSAVLGWANCSSGGTGLTSLGGQTGATQTFANDPNVQMVSAADVHTLTWAGTLATSRGGLGGNFSASSGVLSINAGTVVANNVLTANQLLYGAVGNTVSSEAEFTYDPTNNRVNIGGSAVAFTLNLTTSTTIGDGVHVQGNATNTRPCYHVKSTGAGTVRSYGLCVEGGSGGYLGILDNDAGVARIVLTTAGLLGLGTTTPIDQFHINNTTGQAAMAMSDRRLVGNQLGRIVYDGGSVIAGGGWVFQSLTDVGGFVANLMTVVKATGNVGIGTIAPAQKLSVAGIVESTSGGIKFPDATTQSSAACGLSSACAWTGAHSYVRQDSITLLPFGASSGNTSEVRYRELAANGTNYVGFKAPDIIATNVMWRLPVADSTGTQCLASNGGGELSWAPCSAGITGGGAGTQLAFWTGGTVLSGNSAFTVDTATPRVNVATTYVAPSFTNSRALNVLVGTSGVRVATGGGFVENNSISGFYVQNTDSSSSASLTIGDRTSLAGLIRQTETAGFTGTGYALGAITEVNGSTSTGERGAIFAYTFYNSGANAQLYGGGGGLLVSSAVTSLTFGASGLFELNCGHANCTEKAHGVLSQNLDVGSGFVRAASAFTALATNLASTEAFRDAFRVSSSSIGDLASSRQRTLNDGRIVLTPAVIATTDINGPTQGTLSGNRTGHASIQIPQMYGPSITETSFVAGLSINLADTSTTDAAGATNNGYSSHALIAKHDLNSGFTGFGIGISSYMTSSRTTLVDAAQNNDTYGFLAFIRANDSGAALHVNTIGMYSQLTVDNSSTGAKVAFGAVLSNHTNLQANRHAFTAGNGDATDTSAGTTDFTAGSAFNAFAQVATGTGVQAWTNMLALQNDDGTYRFRVAGDGVIRLSTVAGLETLILDGSVPDIYPVFNNSGRIGHSGNIWNEIWSANVFATTYRTTGGDVGVSCVGISTSSFRSVGGIVTAC